MGPVSNRLFLRYAGVTLVNKELYKRPVELEWKSVQELLPPQRKQTQWHDEQGA